MPRPRRISTAHVEQLGGELCVYDWDRNEVHALNPMAAAVWQLCDGRTTPDQIVARLPATLKTPDAEALVWLSLSLLADAHLLASPIAVPSERGGVSRRALIARLGKAAAIPAISSIVAPTPLQAQSVFSQTFDFAGTQQTFVVPAGVTQLTIAAYGASGGATPSVAPGRGGRVTATVAVTPGEMLSVYVGGEGLAAGGFNGGGGGGGGGLSVAGGGGGASDVRRGSTKLVVAGGGGGAASGPVPAGGGAGGGTTASAGFGLPLLGGGGGSQTAGGAGGDAGGGTSGSLGDGSPGSLGTGGVGANSMSIFGPQLIGGGGGGGGFFGGGGGGASPGHIGAGGGGGGSSYTDPAAGQVTHLSGDHLGHGHIVITWP